MSQYPPAGQPLSYDTTPRKRPTSVTVIAVLAIVFGSLGVLGTLCSLPQWMGVSIGPNRVMDEMRKDSVFVTYTIVSMLIGLALAVMELWGGIGALSLKAPARRVLVRFAIADIVVSVLGLIYGLATMGRNLELMARVVQSTPGTAAAKAQMQQIMQLSFYGGMIGSVVTLIWPVLVLIYMNKPHVKAAFGEGGAYSQ
jgi:hypothetical protein